VASITFGTRSKERRPQTVIPRARLLWTEAFDYLSALIEAPVRGGANRTLWTGPPVISSLPTMGFDSTGS
jgi:hypothetical protein